MSIRVELYGLPRHRAGIESLDVEAGTLGEALRHAIARCPALKDICLESGQLRSGYLANLNGRQFISAPTTPVQTGDTLLIVSADVGG